MGDKKHIYRGKGLGVPGLPHIITEQEAASLGVLDLLKEAIKAGRYRPYTAAKQVKPKGKEGA